MPAQYDPRSFRWHNKIRYLATARYLFGPLFFFQNRLEFSGQENIPQGPVLFVANHLSNWDPPLVARVTGRPVCYLAKEELFSDKFFRPLILAYGAVSVNRDKPEPSTFKAVKEILKQGWSLGMFIEGTRNKNPGVLSKPHLGPAYLAKVNNLPIVPIGIVGLHVKNGKAVVKIGKPIEPSKDLEGTTWKIMEAISELTGFSLPPRELTSQKAKEIKTDKVNPPEDLDSRAANDLV